METISAPPSAANMTPSSAEGAANRQPQPLSRNFEQRIKQLGVITENPTNQQVQKVADKIATDYPEDAGQAADLARNVFGNMRSLIQERADAEVAVGQARRRS